MLFFCYGSDLFMQVFFFFFFTGCAQDVWHYISFVQRHRQLWQAVVFPWKSCSWPSEPSLHQEIYEPWLLRRRTKERLARWSVIGLPFSVMLCIKEVVSNDLSLAFISSSCHRIKMFSTGLHGSPAVLANSLDAVNAMAKKTPPWTIRLSRPTLPFYRTL